MKKLKILSIALFLGFIGILGIDLSCSENQVPILSTFTTSSFAQASVGGDGSVPTGEIKNGRRPDGSSCFYCGPHDWRGCETPGNAC